MKPRPLYRSILFGSGIFIIGFIVWAWWDSSTMASGFHVQRYTAMNREGFIGVMAGEKNSRMAKTGFRSELDPATRVAGFPIRRLAFVRGEAQPMGHDLIQNLPKTEQDKLIRSLKRFKVEAWMIFIPHWLLILAVAGTWAGVMAWQGRRIEEGLKGSSMGG
ncbi:hypothetical protein [Luteolibacter luteus]|uniref:Uncharacterized protein n=1 Tax=Luteolibacter luteus TaxID=2728835 RepID=A0A858RR24_9BACT|nr:hypothetical protein [Luteolibacter luteus]QJE99111.1 hypothetical protein HHL09_26140 [Luteolibacter luteus]